MISNCIFLVNEIECNIIMLNGARCSSVVERPLMVRWVIGLFLVPASVPRLVYQRPWYVLSCLWDGAYKRILAANRKV